MTSPPEYTDPQPSTTNQQRQSAPYFFEAAPGVVAAATALSFCASVIYDVFYYSALGIDLLAAPTTLSDHLRSALQIVPLLALVILLTTLLLYIIHRVGEVLARRTQGKIVAWIKRTAKSRNAWLILLVICTGLVVVVAANLSWRISPTGDGGNSFLEKIQPIVDEKHFIMIVFAFFYCFWAILSHSLFKDIKSAKLRVALKFIPAIAIIIAGTGLLDGRRSFYAVKEQVAIEIGDKVDCYWLLRPLERGILVRTPETTRIDLIPWRVINITSVGAAPKLIGGGLVRNREFDGELIRPSAELSCNIASTNEGRMDN